MTEVPERTVEGRCRDCGARIVWAVTPAGRREALDPEPVSGGNVRLVARHAAILGKRVRARLDAAQARNGLEPIEWYALHAARCPARRRSGPPSGTVEAVAHAVQIQARR